MEEKKLEEEEKIMGWPSATSCQIANLLATGARTLLLYSITPSNHSTETNDYKQSNYFFSSAALESILSEIIQV